MAYVASAGKVGLEEELGATCDSVDAAARKLITDAGLGPGYIVWSVT